MAHILRDFFTGSAIVAVGGIFSLVLLIFFLALWVFFNILGIFAAVFFYIFLFFAAIWLIGFTARKIKESKKS